MENNIKDVNARNKHGDTLLVQAVSARDIDRVETLIAAGADVNLQCHGGYTALILAVDDNAVQIVETLIAAGADVNLRTDYGICDTALRFAVDGNLPNIVKLLLDVPDLKREIDFVENELRAGNPLNNEIRLLLENYFANNAKKD